jgi:hypothetical protein
VFEGWFTNDYTIRVFNDVDLKLVVCIFIALCECEHPNYAPDSRLKDLKMRSDNRRLSRRRASCIQAAMLGVWPLVNIGSASRGKLTCADD